MGSEWIGWAIAFVIGAVLGGAIFGRSGRRAPTPVATTNAAPPPAAAPTGGGDERLRAAMDDAASLRDRLAQAETALRALRRG